MALPTDGFIKKIAKSLVYYPSTIKLIILAIIMTLIGIVDAMWRNNVISFEDGKLVKDTEALQVWKSETANGRN